MTDMEDGLVEICSEDFAGVLCPRLVLFSCLNFLVVLCSVFSLFTSAASLFHCKYQAAAPPASMF